MRPSIYVKYRGCYKIFFQHFISTRNYLFFKLFKFSVLTLSFWILFFTCFYFYFWMYSVARKQTWSFSKKVHIIAKNARICYKIGIVKPISNADDKFEFGGYKTNNKKTARILNSWNSVFEWYLGLNWRKSKELWENQISKIKGFSKLENGCHEDRRTTNW